MLEFRDTFFLVVGKPPVNGMTVISSYIIDKYGSINNNEYAIVRKKFKRKSFWLLQKWVDLFRNLISYLLFRRKKWLYIVSESGKGIVFTYLIMSLSILTKRRVYLHHHVFSYINKHNYLISKISNYKNVVHIFLCNKMRDKFTDKYGQVNSIIINNKNFFDIKPKQIMAGSSAKLKVGLLSNLNKEKGLFDFLYLVKSLSLDKFEFHLAGPIVNSDDRKFVKKEEIIYYGPVQGELKNKFYSEIDVFVFPTKYKNEAQPLVLYEAMEFGKYIITYDRGCIKSQVEGHGLIVNDKEELKKALNDYYKQHING